MALLAVEAAVVGGAEADAGASDMIFNSIKYQISGGCHVGEQRVQHIHYSRLTPSGITCRDHGRRRRQGPRPLAAMPTP